MSSIQEIVAEEWRQFQQVKNEGGRAACQDNWEEFRRQRESQFRAWSPELRESYYQDLREAAAAGRNLLTEKYAYMMKETAPKRFAALARLLPPISREKQALVESIVAVHLAWAGEFAAAFPLYAATGRPLRRTEAGPGETAIETYLRGELSTYSERTLGLYAAFAADCQAKGVNLARQIRDHAARDLGLSGSEEAEALLRRKYSRT